jgi:hypothetical protein
LHDYSSGPKFEDDLAEDNVAKPTKAKMAQSEKPPGHWNGTAADGTTEPSQLSVFDFSNRWSTEGAILALYLIGKH